MIDGDKLIFEKIRLILSELCPFSILTICMDKHIVGDIVFYKHTFLVREIF